MSSSSLFSGKSVHRGDDCCEFSSKQRWLYLKSDGKMEEEGKYLALSQTTGNTPPPMAFSYLRCGLTNVCALVVGQGVLCVRQLWLPLLC